MILGDIYKANLLPPCDVFGSDEEICIFNFSLLFPSCGETSAR